MAFEANGTRFELQSEHQLCDAENINHHENHENNEGFMIKRSVDRAMTLTALIFIVVTFLGMLILAWYISRRRRKDYARWRKMTELAMKSNIKEKSDKQTQITFDHSDEKETCSLNKSIHSLDNNSHFDDGDPEVGDDKQDIEAQFEQAKTNSEHNDHCQKPNDEYSDFNLRYEELSVQNTSKIMETIKSINEVNTCKENNINQFNSDITITSNTTTDNNDNNNVTELSDNNHIELSEKKRTKSKRIASNSNNHLISNQSVIDRNQLTDTLNDNIMNSDEYTDLKEEEKEIGVNVIKNSHITTQQSKKSNITIRNDEMDHNFDPSKRLSIENQYHHHKTYNPIISNTIGHQLRKSNYPIANILSNAILDRPYINADEIHTFFDQHSSNSTLNPYHDLEYYNPMNTKISSTLPRDYKQEIYTTNVKNRNNNNNGNSNGNNNNNNNDSVHRNQPSRYLNKDYKSNKLIYGQQEPFTVASQHDALLSELLNRGMNSNPGESRPKSTF
ncbi:unnamed protein product [Schistosoma margrebowiei]|uniref:Uncharacterized protein n=1 Tax=Schistosoma margrebowiei TaxID=48269 RepID=A0A183N6S9_9TREM|nr:unnamed protein product [Schistosoma margrebowiei]